MNTVEANLFPDGVPPFLTIADFGRLLGVSHTQAKKIASERPSMTVVLPSMKDKRVRSELYFELVGKK